MPETESAANRLILSFSRQAWLLASVVFICRLGAMVKLFMAIYLKVTLGLPIEVIGLLLSGYGAGLVAGSYLAGIASDHCCTKKLIQALMLLSAATLLALPELTHWLAISVALVISGAFDGGVRTLHQRLIMDFCPPAQRDRSQALSRVGINLGMACAGLMGGLLSNWDIHALFYVSSGLLAAATWAFAAGSRQWVLVAERPANCAPQAPSSPYKDLRFLGFLGGCCLIALAYEPIYSTLGNYLIEHYQLTTAAIGWQFALNGLMVVGLQIPLSNWTSGWGVRNQLVAGSVLLGLGLGLIPYGMGVAYLSACTVVWTLGELLFMPAMGIHVMQLAEGKKSGHYFGLYSLFWSVGTLLSPALASQIYSRFGADSLWLSCCALALVAILLICLTVKSPRT